MRAIHLPLDDEDLDYERIKPHEMATSVNIGDATDTIIDRFDLTLRKRIDRLHYSNGGGTPSHLYLDPSYLGSRATL